MGHRRPEREIRIADPRHEPVVQSMRGASSLAKEWQVQPDHGPFISNWTRVADHALGAASVGQVTSASASRRPSFVLHDHRKPRPHFDLRLEDDGLLRSWALPRGVPTSSAQNRLAIAVPDHDLNHLAYTDADKSIADTGWWEEHDRTDRRIVFTLHGSMGPLRYALIHTGTDWLLHLVKGQTGGA